MILQIVVAAVIFLGVLGVGRWAIRVLATPVPDEPDPDDIVDVEVPFRCTVCGMRLVVVHAQDAAVTPPRHCREEMEPV